MVGSAISIGGGPGVATEGTVTSPTINQGGAETFIPTFDTEEEDFLSEVTGESDFSDTLIVNDLQVPIIQSLEFIYNFYDPQEEILPGGSNNDTETALELIPRYNRLAWEPVILPQQFQRGDTIPFFENGSNSNAGAENEQPLDYELGFGLNNTANEVVFDENIISIFTNPVLFGAGI